MSNKKIYITDRTASGESQASLFFWAYAICLLMYFPTYSISLILGVKLHWILSLALIVSSLCICLSRRIVVISIFSVAAIIAIKLAYGFSDIKSLFTSLTGFSVIAAASSISSSHPSLASRLAKYGIAYFAIVAVIVVLQSVGILPLSLGHLQFVNYVVGTFGLIDSGTVRPNGYMFHPFDAVLALVPLIYYLAITRPRVAFIVALLLELIIYLKSWIVCALLLPLVSQIRTRAWAIVAILVFVPASLYVAWLATLYGDRVFFAGRTSIWNLYFDFLIYRFEFIEWLVGRHRAISSIPTIFGIESYGNAHHMVIFLLTEVGVVGAGLFLAQLIFLVRRVYTNMRFPATVMLAVLFSLGMSGSLINYLPFWVSSAFVLIVHAAYRSSGRDTKMQWKA